MQRYKLFHRVEIGLMQEHTKNIRIHGDSLVKQKLFRTELVLTLQMTKL